jgi:hypothetical protein
MDIKEQIQLGQERTVDSVNVDTTIKFGFESSKKQSIEYNIQNILDVTQVFDDERQAVNIYRIHGEFEYLSILNGMPIDYQDQVDFFRTIPISAETKNIFTDLKIYLVKPSTGYTQLDENRYIRNYEVIATPDEIDIQRAGYATNIFNEQQYSLIVTKDIDISNQFDGLNFPLTNVYFYVEYQPQTNGLGEDEFMRIKTFDSSGNTSTEIDFTPVPLTNGDVISGDVITFSLSNYSQVDYNLAEQYVFMPYLPSNDKLAPDELKFKYNPFIPVTLRVLEEDIQRANTGSTSNDEVSEIPSYAIPTGEGNFIWRNLLDKGFFDPITGVGVSYPFINQKHYVFNNTIFSMSPDTSDGNTNFVFNEIRFSPNELIKAEPNSSTDNLAKGCA